MHSDGSVEIQGLLDRMRQGDAQARRLVLERACERLRRLAGRLLYGSFPDVARRHDVDSVVHEAWVRLLQTLVRAEPPTVADFFRLAAHKIRQVFEMHYYLGLSQAEIARVLEVHPRKVSYLWIAATEKLGDGLDVST
jgi:DNA-directed RNA polymerase specialized sigma24 family protein